MTITRIYYYYLIGVRADLELGPFAFPFIPDIGYLDIDLDIDIIIDLDLDLDREPV